ncbi:MAG: hypothetical protein GWN76_15045, partial [candidate division Zixibacteria bacterium]|nr:hypothetical protein [candidate division Zixibacteria bacterium]
MLAVQEELVIAQLIGSCRQTESRRMVDSLQKNWQASIRKNEERIERYVRVRGRMELADSAFLQTANWSKAMLAANQHYLNKQIVPMPCPAEYNFYFTHDVLLTDLGAVVFDSQRVKNDLLYLRSLTQSDSVLP